MAELACKIDRGHVVITAPGRRLSAQHQRHSLLVRRRRERCVKPICRYPGKVPCRHEAQVLAVLRDHEVFAETRADLVPRGRGGWSSQPRDGLDEEG